MPAGDEDGDALDPGAERRSLPARPHDDVEDDEEEEGNPFVEDQAEEAVEEDEDDKL